MLKTTYTQFSEDLVVEGYKPANFVALPVILWTSHRFIIYSSQF